MNGIIRKGFQALICAWTLLVPAQQVAAEDIEIYLDNSTAASTRPNVLFVIDNSGSMSTKVQVTQQEWDASKTWPGSCDTSRIYWTSNSSAPGCGTSKWFNASALNCDSASGPLASTGYFSDKIARWKDHKKAKKRKWTTLSSKVRSAPVECQDDSGEHGSNSNPTGAKYAANKGDGPWNSSNGKEIDWSKQTAYTLYSGNYLNWKSNAGSVTKTRLQIVQEVAKSLVDSTAGINIGLMSFNVTPSNEQGGSVDIAIDKIEDVRTAVKTEIDTYSPQTWTPLSETLHEAGLYFRGEKIFLGVNSIPDSRDPSDSTRYESPIQNECQSNSVVILTDGAPTRDSNAESRIKALPGFSGLKDKTCAHSADNCLDELADYLYNVDQVDDASMAGTQRIKTYTVGFQIDHQLLKDTATKGNGLYFTADGAAQLADSLTAVFRDILNTNSTFSAPAVTVNAFNRLRHRDELYYALFKPAADVRWGGNVKRYRFDSTTGKLVDSSTPPKAAINPLTGQFADNTTSYWTVGGPDGDNTLAGGFASRLTKNRLVYTWTPATAPSNSNLFTATNRVLDSNNSITTGMLGLSATDTTLRSEVLQWASGIDVLNEDSVDADGDGDPYNDARTAMGDPLHSRPVLVSYGGTAASPDITLYMTTNEGYLHAVNTATGAEVFSFIPQELLPNLPPLYDDVAGDKIYGLDGPITLWFNDLNRNGVLYNSANQLEADLSGNSEHAYLYIGMRRGGPNYYALDVTDRSSPKLKWIIKGGQGDFAELGQTWSSAIFTRIRYNCVSGTCSEKPVLVFGGGYDPDQDLASVPTPDSVGRAIYMVDAETGQRFWWAGPPDGDGDTTNDPDLVLSDMDYSIPADITPVDINNDGYLDYFFAADMGGQVWRFDVQSDQTLPLVKGGVVARFHAKADGTACNGSDSTCQAKHNRRFYNAPDVALIRNRAKGDVLTVALGSGFRAHPLDKVVEDRFYVFFDHSPFGAPASYGTISEANLYDATQDLIQDGATASDRAAALQALQSKKGWFISLTSPGEKVLAPSITFGGKLLFSTFRPAEASSNVCGADAGLGRLYLLNLLDATSVADINGDSSTNKGDRVFELKRVGIPPEPLVLFTAAGPVVVVGTEVFKPFVPGNPLERTFWREN